MNIFLKCYKNYFFRNFHIFFKTLSKKMDVFIITHYFLPKIKLRFPSNSTLNMNLFYHGSRFEKISGMTSGNLDVIEEILGELRRFYDYSVIRRRILFYDYFELYRKLRILNC